MPASVSSTGSGREPIEHAGVRDAFEVGDLLAHRGLGVPELLGGGAERASRATASNATRCRSSSPRSPLVSVIFDIRNRPSTYDAA